LDDGNSNATSIAMLVEVQGKSVLLLGDAIPAVLDDAVKGLLKKRKLKRLQVDYVKLAHHGSTRSLSDEFLSMVDCNNYIFSTNGRASGLPNKSCVARIVTNPKRNCEVAVLLYFNYPEVGEKMKFTAEEFATYNFDFGNSKSDFGLKIKII
jgi:hypothetical protein